jgi:hypothetical protein
MLEVVMKVMRCALLCMPQALKGGLNLLEAPEVLEFWSFLELLEVMSFVLLCVLEVVEGGLSSLEVLEFPGASGDDALFAGGDLLCAALYAALYTEGCAG